MRKIPTETKAKLNKLSDISADIGQIALGSIVIPVILDKFDLLLLIWGLVMMVTFWILSFLLAN